MAVRNLRNLLRQCIGKLDQQFELSGSNFQMKYLYKFLQLVDRAEIAKLKISQKAYGLPLIIEGTNQDKEILLEKMTYIVSPMGEE